MPTRTISSVKLLLVVKATPVGDLPVSDTEPRSRCRYSAFQVQLPAIAPSMPAPAVQPTLVDDAAKLVAAEVVNALLATPSVTPLIVVADVADTPTLP